MRFAAKRTWPDRPKSWEHQGEAESLQAFALAFAESRGLGVNTELAVLDKDSDEAALELFRVTGTDPYTLAPAGPRPAGDASPEQQPAATPAPDSASHADDPAIPPPPVASSAFGFLFFMAKTAVGFGLGVVILYQVLRFFFPEKG